MRKAFLSILFVFNLLSILALIISYLAVYIPPDKLWYPAAFGIAYPFLLIANILFIIFWLLIKPRYLLWSLATIILGWGFLIRYVQVKGEKADEADIKVLSYNVKYFYGDETKTRKETADNIVSFLEEVDADIICLQEARIRRNRIFNLRQTVKDLSSINHYQYARTSQTFGSVTMTKYPIINMEEVRFEESRNMAIFTDVVIDKDTVRIFNVHLQSYQIDPDKYSIIDSPGIDEEEDLKEVREMGNKFKKAVKLRARQVRHLKELIKQSPYEVLVCGDFNDTPVSFAYQTLRGDLTDAFVSSGKGIGKTYIGKLPSFRIDNIFHGDKFDSYNFQTYDFRLSDHLPISCELVRK